MIILWCSSSLTTMFSPTSACCWSTMLPSANIHMRAALLDCQSCLMTTVPGPMPSMPRRQHSSGTLRSGPLKMSGLCLGGSLPTSASGVLSVTRWLAPTVILYTVYTVCTVILYYVCTVIHCNTSTLQYTVIHCNTIRL